MDEKNKLEELDKEKSVRAKLQEILSEIRACIDRGEEPPIGLVDQARDLVDQYPNNARFDKLLSNIINTAHDFTHLALEEISTSGISIKDFDTLLFQDPLKTMSDYFEDKNMASNKITIDNMISGERASIKDIINAANEVNSKEGKHKLKSITNEAALEFERMKNREESEENRADLKRNMDNIAKKRLFVHVVADCKRKHKKMNIGEVIEEGIDTINDGMQDLVKTIGNDLHRLVTLCAYDEKAIDEFVRNKDKDKLIKQIEQAELKNSEAIVKENKRKEMVSFIKDKSVKSHTHHGRIPSPSVTPHVAGHHNKRKGQHY